MKSWEMVASCKDCGAQKIKRKDEWHENYLCQKCSRAKRGKQLGDTYGKAQVKEVNYCTDCSKILHTSPYARRCRKCDSDFKKNNFSGAGNPAWTGKSVCKCGTKKKPNALECRSCSFSNGKRSGSNNGRFIEEDRIYWEECKRVRSRLSTVMCNSLKKAGIRKNYRKTLDLLGYSWEDFKSHIDNLKTDDMLWISNKRNWDIDHIIPVNWFIKNKVFDPKIVNCLKNLQPLSKAENVRKYDHCDLNIEEVEEFLGVKLKITKE